MLNVLLISHRALIREGLKIALAKLQDMNFSEAEGPIDGIDRFLESNPDMVVIDIDIRGCDTVNYIRRIRSKSSAVSIMVLDSATNAAEARRVIKAGANGYLTLLTPLREIIEGIRLILLGRTFIDMATSEYLANSLLGENDNELSVLSPRETDVLKSMLDGSDTRAIAQKFNISVNTVGNHKRSIRRKLRVKTDMQLARVAVSNHLLQDDHTETQLNFL